MTTTRTLNSMSRQRGAALVISLVLLMVLTLLAVSTMSTASLEVTMAGNNQYAQNAFQLAETAAEQQLRTTEANTDLCVNNVNPTVCDLPVTAVPNMAGEYQTTTRFVSPKGVCLNSSDQEVLRFDFEVQAIGRSADNAVSQHTQGWHFCFP